MWICKPKKVKKERKFKRWNWIKEKRNLNQHKGGREKMSNGEHEIRTPKGLRIGNRSVVDGKNMLQIRRGAVKIIFLLNLWWSVFTAFPWRVSNFSQQRTNEKKPEAECFIGHWKRRGGILGGTWLADQLHQTFFWVYNIISVCLERYRSNMWYRPEQNERMQRRSAPASSSSCSGFFYFSKFFEKLYSKMALRIPISIGTSNK